MTKRNKVVKHFNSYFALVTESLDLFNWPYLSGNATNATNKVQKITDSFSNHPSILKITQKFWINKKFSFTCVSEATVRKSVESLLSDKATAGGIPINVLKSSDFCFSKLTKCINEAFTNKKFPENLKDITPVYKKLDPSDKTIYKPVSI